MVDVRNELCLECQPGHLDSASCQTEAVQPLLNSASASGDVYLSNDAQACGIAVIPSSVTSSERLSCKVELQIVCKSRTNYKNSLTVQQRLCKSRSPVNNTHCIPFVGLLPVTLALTLMCCMCFPVPPTVHALRPQGSALTRGMTVFSNKNTPGYQHNVELVKEINVDVMLAAISDALSRQLTSHQECIVSVKSAATVDGHQKV
eukprot:364100-Chlamydomonas_euryale.AAC.36